MRKFCILFCFFLVAKIGLSQESPKEHFGFNMGDDYQISNNTQTEAYFRKLAAASDRVKFVEIGKTEEGRPHYMLILSAPENLQKLDHYREISRKLALADGVSDQEALALASEGKAVVWIDGGLHATETLGIHQLIETAWNLASRKDAETMNILQNTIILMAHANPDGHELVGNWYMREKTPEKRSLQGVPRLYEKYAGHDNNRDFFMLNLKESQNIANQLYIEWLPQIMYNHHQAGPPGSVVAGPPFRDPFNYVFDPIIMTSIDALGAALNTRLNVEGKPGYTQKYGSVYSTWYNGGLRTTTYFHNMIGLLTETVGGPNPSEIPLVPERLIPNGGTTYPVTPQKWHFRQSIDYSVSMNYAVLNYAARHRDELLHNIYVMGRNSINRGNTDTWGLSPKKIEAINAAYKKDQQAARIPATIPSRYFDTVLRDLKSRDPRGYIIPSDQEDFPTAIKFINALIRTGIFVHKANTDFTVAGRKYPKGSYIIRTNQAFRPHVLDMFEPQDHPNDFKYEGGPPIAPYDAAGWTLAYMMNVKFDRILDDFTGPFERLPFGELQKPEARNLASAGGYYINAQSNDAFRVVNELLAAGQPVSRISSGENQGDFYIPSGEKSKRILNEQISGPGVVVRTAAGTPKNLSAMKPLRIALWDTYGGSMPSGWIRFLMDQYKFNANVIFAQEIDAGNLNSKYDVIILVPGAIPSTQSRDLAPSAVPPLLPDEYRTHTGRITSAKSIPELKKFLENGGRVVAIGSSTNLAYHLGLPVKDHLIEIEPGGVERRPPAEHYYIPGSILQVDVDNSIPSTWGMGKSADIYFANSPVFRINTSAISGRKIRPLMWFSAAKPLRSGWAWGQEYLQDGISAFEAEVGRGKLYAFGSEITFRAQTHGTFKLLFNQLYSTGN